MCRVAKCYGKNALISIVLLMVLTISVIELFVRKFTHSAFFFHGKISFPQISNLKDIEKTFSKEKMVIKLFFFYLSRKQNNNDNNNKKRIEARIIRRNQENIGATAMAPETKRKVQS